MKVVKLGKKNRYVSEENVKVDPSRGRSVRPVGRDPSRVVTPKGKRRKPAGIDTQSDKEGEKQKKIAAYPLRFLSSCSSSGRPAAAATGARCVSGSCDAGCCDGDGECDAGAAVGLRRLLLLLLLLARSSASSSRWLREAKSYEGVAPYCIAKKKQKTKDER